MATYVISYDLHKSENNRRKVEKSIEEIGEYLKCLTTTYFVKTPLAQEDVLIAASKHLDDNDKMIIFELTEKISGWLKTEERERVLNFL